MNPTAHSALRQVAIAAAIGGAVALALQLLLYGVAQALPELGPQAAIPLAPIMLALMGLGIWAGVRQLGVPRAWVAALGGVLGWLGVHLVPVVALVELALPFVEFGLAAVLVAATLAAAAGTGAGAWVARHGPSPGVIADRG